MDLVAWAVWRHPETRDDRRLSDEAPWVELLEDDLRSRRGIDFDLRLDNPPCPPTEKIPSFDEAVQLRWLRDKSAQQEIDLKTLRAAEAAARRPCRRLQDDPGADSER
jgi:hypothetical protein